MHRGFSINCLLPVVEKDIAVVSVALLVFSESGKTQSLVLVGRTLKYLFGGG